MKQAAGEANMTVVAIILIAAIVAIVTPIVNSMMKSVALRSCCQNKGGYWEGSVCYHANGNPMPPSVYWNERESKCY